KHFCARAHICLDDDDDDDDYDDDNDEDDDGGSCGGGIGVCDKNDESHHKAH
ncbi:hypothetical protein CHS0354_002429, partial [Potamilus streckersoni]